MIQRGTPGPLVSGGISICTTESRGHTPRGTAGGLSSNEQRSPKKCGKLSETTEDDEPLRLSKWEAELLDVVRQTMDCGRQEAKKELRKLLDDARFKTPQARLAIAIAWCCDDPDEMLVLSGFYPF